MNIEEQNEAKEFYLKSDVNAIHTQKTNSVEINYLDLLKLMHSYAEFKVKNLVLCAVVKELKADKETLTFNEWIKTLRRNEAYQLIYKGKAMSSESLLVAYKKEINKSSH